MKTAIWLMLAIVTLLVTQEGVQGALQGLKGNSMSMVMMVEDPISQRRGAIKLLKGINEDQVNGLGANPDLAKALEDQFAELEEESERLAQQNKEAGQKIATATASGISKIVVSVKSKKGGVAITSAVFEAAAGIATAVPGGQGVGFALALIGTVIGWFSPAIKPLTSAAGKQLTADDIQRVVREVFKQETVSNNAMKWLNQCLLTKNDVNELVTKMDYWRELGLDMADANNGVSLNNAMSTWMANFRTVAKNVNDNFESTKNYLLGISGESKLITTKTCMNTCKLLTVPYPNWAGTGDINLVAPEWAPCPLQGADECGSDCDRAGNPAYKMCLKHLTWMDHVCSGGDQFGGCSDWERPKVTIDEGCAKRVANIESCEKDYNLAQEQHKMVEQLLNCNKENVLNLATTLYQLKTLAAYYGNFPWYNGNFLADWGDLNTVSLKNRLMTPFLTWDLKKANKGTFSSGALSGAEYDCSDEPKDATPSWVHKLGYSDDLILMNAPCSTSDYCRMVPSSTNTAYCSDTIRCDKIAKSDVNGGKVPWEFETPKYNYEQIFN